MIDTIVKRDGREMPFESDKIAQAVRKAFEATGQNKDEKTCAKIAQQVVHEAEEKQYVKPTVEQIQDLVEGVLIEERLRSHGQGLHPLPGGAHPRARDADAPDEDLRGHHLQADAIDSDIKRENANINGDTAMGTMLKYGSEGAKQFNEMFVLKPRARARPTARAISTSTTWIFYTLTTTCCQIDLHQALSAAASPPATACCASRTTSPAIPRWPASPSSPTRTTSTAASASSTLTTAMADGRAKDLPQALPRQRHAAAWSCWSARQGRRGQWTQTHGRPGEGDGLTPGLWRQRRLSAAEAEASC